MKALIAAAAFAAVALPSAAYAADGEMEKCCCCDKIKHEGKDCCEDKDAPAPNDNPAGHGEHQPAAPSE